MERPKPYCGYDGGLDGGPANEASWCSFFLDDVLQPSASGAVRSAVVHMVRHHARCLRLTELASIAGRTTFQLIRAFRRELGLTPHVLLLRVRIEAGTAMLLQGEPLAEIADAVGFSDQAHFTRHFKRVHGRTPTEFLRARRMVRVRRAGAVDDRSRAGLS